MIDTKYTVQETGILQIKTKLEKIPSILIIDSNSLVKNRTYINTYKKNGYSFWNFTVSSGEKVCISSLKEAPRIIEYPLPCNQKDFHIEIGHKEYFDEGSAIYCGKETGFAFTNNTKQKNSLFYCHNVISSGILLIKSKSEVPPIITKNGSIINFLRSYEDKKYKIYIIAVSIGDIVYCSEKTIFEEYPLPCSGKNFGLIVGTLADFEHRMMIYTGIDEGFIYTDRDARDDLIDELKSKIENLESKKECNCFCCRNKNNLDRRYGYYTAEYLINKQLAEKLKSLGIKNDSLVNNTLGSLLTEIEWNRDSAGCLLDEIERKLNVYDPTTEKSSDF